jgi:hypothetical protein
MISGKKKKLIFLKNHVWTSFSKRKNVIQAMFKRVPAYIITITSAPFFPFKAAITIYAQFMQRKYGISFWYKFLKFGKAHLRLT